MIFFKRNVQDSQQTRRLIKNINDCLESPFICIDAEGGIVNRLPDDLFDLPSARALNSIEDEALVKQAYSLHAEVLEYLGFNLNFSPVLDLFKDKNAVIGVRAFSEDPEQIAQYAQIAIEAYQERKILAVAKHFPGHGSSDQDTHLGEVHCEKSIERLLKEDIKPYQLSLDLIQAIMPAHVKYSKVDPDNPATFSRKLIQQQLKEKLNFKGLVFSDCLEMKSISDNFTPNEIVEKALHAGLDCLLSSFSILKSEKFISELAFALSEKRNPKAVNKLLGLRQKYTAKKAQKEYKEDFLSSSDISIQIHTKSIEVKRKKSFYFQSRNLFIVEIFKDSKKWINDSPELSLFTKKISNNLHSFQIKSQVFSESDNLELKLSEIKKENVGYDVIVVSNLQHTFHFEDPELTYISLFSDESFDKYNLNIICRGYNHITSSAIEHIFNSCLQDN